MFLLNKASWNIDLFQLFSIPEKKPHLSFELLHLFTSRDADLAHFKTFDSNRSNLTNLIFISVNSLRGGLCQCGSLTFGLQLLLSLAPCLLIWMYADDVSLFTSSLLVLSSFPYQTKRDVDMVLVSCRPFTTRTKLWMTTSFQMLDDGSEVSTRNDITVGNCDIFCSKAWRMETLRSHWNQTSNGLCWCNTSMPSWQVMSTQNSSHEGRSRLSRGNVKERLYWGIWQSSHQTDCSNAALWTYKTWWI